MFYRSKYKQRTMTKPTRITLNASSTSKLSPQKQVRICVDSIYNKCCVQEVCNVNLTIFLLCVHFTNKCIDTLNITLVKIKCNNIDA